MKRLDIEKVKIKNFLSYGNKPTEIPFLPGVNIVLGYDEETKKSNGSGKSSFLESIPFALFGKLHRNIKKSQIINWKNRKNCLVDLDFSKDQIKYKVRRGIKPDIFEIYEDEKLIKKPAHVKDYQVILEEILGLNFKTFMSIFHSNINSSTNILSMKKPEKRVFVEKVFGLELYTNMIKVCNAKENNINSKISEINTQITFNENNINDSDRRIKEYKRQLPSISSLKLEISDAEEDFEKYKEKYDDVITPNLKDDYEKQNIENQYYSVILEKLKNKKNILLSKIKSFEQSLTYLDDSVKVQEKIKYLEEKRDKITQKIGDTEKIENKIKKVNEIIDEISGIIEKLDEKTKSYRIELRNIEKRIESIISLKDENKCPLCFSDLRDSSKVRKHLNQELENLYADKKILKDEVIVLEKQIEENKGDSHKKKKLLSSLSDIHNKLLNTLSELSKCELEDKDNSEKISKFEKQIEKYRKVVYKLSNKEEEVDNKKQICNKRLLILQEDIDKLKYYENCMEEAEKKINEINLKIEDKEAEKRKILGFIESENNNINDLSKQNVGLKTKKGKLNNIIDYIQYIKLLCKDENVKQFAISYIMPLLNKKVNEYLSEMEYPFYVVLDKWLESTIKGPGITNASYDSLSGGERKSIDLSIQFSFLDIGMAKAGVFMNMIAFDELLDSSIDGVGINKVAEIIRLKQKEDELFKFFIVSHKLGIVDEFIADNIYNVRKSKGYSSVSLN